MFRRILLTFLLIFAFTTQSFAFWIWSPKNKTWTNPKWTAKSTPKDQFEFAKNRFDVGDYKQAYEEFRKVTRYFPKALEAPEAQFYIGQCLEKFDKLYAAHLAYQKIIDKYPFSNKLNDVIERQFYIAGVLTEKKAKFLGLQVPQYTAAIEIYRKIIENAPYHQLAPLSQYKIALILKSLDRFTEAKDEFEKVIASYPESEWAEAARYQVALTASTASLKPEYDQALTKEAKSKFEEFVEKHAESKLTLEAEHNLVTLASKEAEKDYKTAQFYEKQRSYSSAAIYYQGIIENYPKTEWAQKAQERMQALEKGKKL